MFKLKFRPSKKKRIKLRFFNTSKFPKRSQRELKLIDKDPFGDKDRDGVKNFFDCKPMNKFKQGRWAHPIAKNQRQYIKKIKEYHGGPHIVEYPEKHGYLEIYSRTGIKGYKKMVEEKLADINKSEIAAGYDAHTPQDEIRVWSGSGKIIEKGRTGDKVIIKTKRSYPAEYPGQEEGYGEALIVIDKKTGDSVHYKPGTNYSKKTLNEQKGEDNSQYLPIIELENTLENVKGSKRLTKIGDYEQVKEEKKARRHKYDSPMYSNYEEIPFKEMEEVELKPIDIKDED